jgi:hypothetical protein
VTAPGVAVLRVLLDIPAIFAVSRVSALFRRDLVRGLLCAEAAKEGLMPEVSNVSEKLLSPEQRRTLRTLRRPIMDAARSFGAIREKLADLAPKVVKLFNGIVADNERFTFVDYVRMFDPTVPTHAADRDGTTGYRNHRTYYTLAYMRRMVAQTGRPRGQQGVRDSATDALARMIATVLQIVSEPEQVYGAVQTEFQFSERLMTRLRKRVDLTKPLIKLEATKPAKIGNVIHMPRTAPAAAQGPEEALARPGQRVTLPAPSEGPRARKLAKTG